MFFRVNPSSKLGRRILRARLSFALAYSKALAKEGIPLAKESKKLYQQANALWEMAHSADETGDYFRFAWLRFCAKFVSYRGDWALRRSIKLRARDRRSHEKAIELCELLGHKTTESGASEVASHDDG